MSKIIKTLGVWLTEAAIAGAPMIPLFIFVTSFIEHEGDFTYVLPFVLFYTFNKAGEYTLGMFGEVENPYRIALITALIVTLGSIICLFGVVSVIFYDVGAVLIGFGSSIFGTMYRSVKSVVQDQGDFNFWHPDDIGFALMVVFSSLILFAQGQLQEVIIASYVALSIISFFTMRSIGRTDPKRNEPLFDYSKHDLKKGIPGLFMLLVAFFARLFKQTANVTDVIILFLIAAGVMVAIGVTRTYKNRKRYEWNDVYYGEVLIFMLLYDVFYYIGQGNIALVLLVNLAQFAGQFAAMLLGKKIMGAMRKLKISTVLVALSMVSGIFFLIPWTNLLGILLIGFITKLGFMRVGKLYHNSENALSVASANINSQKMSGIGIIAGQTILVVILAFVSFFMLHNSTAAMASYALRIFNSDLIPVFHVTQWICMILFWIQGAVMLIYGKAKTGTFFKSEKAS